MKKFCENAIVMLTLIQGKEWAEEYVRLRMTFHRQHGYNLIHSTWHGADFFANVLASLNGEDIKEPAGEYKNNFKKLIDFGMKEGIL